MPTFRHYDLSLLNPAFDSPLVDVLTELEHLRRLHLVGTTPAPMFFQLKHVFHMLESLGSARIEGNHTTLADYVESKLEGSRELPSDQLREMGNIEAAMAYIEESVQQGHLLTEHFVRELHAITVGSLEREGDASPGAYRRQQVTIARSEHLPPEFLLVPQYMQELVAFINENHPPKYDLIKVALAHHRFGWIHPFGNGNGRVVRLLTYSLLIKYGFNVQAGGRVLNPTAVFCNDRDRYYAMLEKADAGTPTGLETWCIYVLQGILDELRKVDRLTDFTYLADNILLPAIAFARERELITMAEARILQIGAQTGITKALDLSPAMPGMTSAQRTYQIRKLVERKMLLPIKEGARQYTLGFSNSFLLRGIISALSEEGFIPPTLNQPA
ncbi:Fic family protein [Desulfomicrobium baculatum]|uniref:Filamentation induced by cAMP protein Fic n=1 Tax=Desulfomicrobium baculatum (strain DSM 4028 / VKM B-1378 / X) TaxID=525897 RepID=C7LNI7_DESBD|nr:Fic family protein [Desulfomicrobium baculatum]ACU88872.1 filamentation induced by cAMP protein Fic [Desulfomicrobium baculatum DSM 4028]